MKSIILSCTPAECEKIVNGNISILVRKKVPKETPFKVYVYETQGATETPWVDEDGHFIYKGRGKVIGEFVCNKVKKYEPHVILCACYEVNGADVKENLRYNKGTCLSYEEMVKKSNGKPLYGLHISDLKIYDEPREVSEFRACNGNCNHCKHRVVNPNDVGDVRCENKITRPPKNYIYVEE